MSSLHDNPFLLASGSPTDPTFPVQRSVRLRRSATASLTRTVSVAGNRRTWTWSAWIKRGTLGASQTLFDAYSTNENNDTQVYIGASDNLAFSNVISGSQANGFYAITNSVFRDPSAWYHVVFSVDTTQSTAVAALKVYVNGVQQTFSSTTYGGGANQNTWVNSATTHIIGQTSPPNSSYFDGYLTEVNFIDGQALTPSSFGGYNSGTGVWEPRKYTGTYGTNGFYLNFQDNSGATATTIGKDSSGNSNNWTPNNISVTAGVTYDSMLDVPTNTSPTNANFATLNPLEQTSAVTLSNANLSYSCSSGSSCRATMGTGTTGLYYFEHTITSTIGLYTPIIVGATTNTLAITNINNEPLGLNFYTDSSAWQVQKRINGTITSINVTGTSYPVNGNILQIAYDATNGKAWLGKNNNWIDSSGGITGNPSAGTNPTFTFTAGQSIFPCLYNVGAPYSGALNCGQRPFSYTPPTGFVALNTYNLPDPTIPSGDDFHKVYTYTGNGGGLQVGEIQKPASLFNLDRSLRFRKSNSAYFNRTFSTPTSGTTWTWSGWVKRGALDGVDQILFSKYQDANNLSLIRFNDTNGIRFYDYSGGVLRTERTTTAVYRDCNLWYHIVVAYDSGNATAANRVKIYVNGVEISVFSTSTNPNQNQTSILNSSGTHQLSAINSTAFFDGYLADVYFIDGQALTPTDFGAYDGNYYWTPKAYTGTYGTNGFHLEFEDFSAATAAAIGKDTSGNVNNWTPNGINVTTPANTNVSWDSMVDVPTLTSTDVANYCVIDPLFTGANGISNANLTVTYAAASVAYQQLCTFTVDSGKWYHEANLSSFSVGDAGNNVQVFGWASKSNLNTNIRYGWMTDGSVMRHSLRYALNGTQQTRINIDTVTPVSTDIFSLAFDISTGTITAYKNGTQTAQITGVSNVGDWTPYIARDGTSNAATWHMNFGQRGFKYPVTEFKALNSFNVAEVTSDLELPDFVWIKSRSAATSHALFNSVSGVGKYLSSNATTAETTDVNSLIQFNKNGFLLGNAAIVNTSAATYVASAWKAGGTAVTNTAGSITSQVSANQKAGFSIVTYTGTGANATVGHGLGIAPKMVIMKSRSLAGQNWIVYHANMDSSAPQNYVMGLNLTVAKSLDSTMLNNTAPTSSVWSIGTNTSVNNSTSTYVAYCFSEVAGFSKFGSYTGNGSADGIFVHTGFRPRWVMIKSSTGTESWYVYDSSRNTYNVADSRLYPNLSSAEGTGGSYGPDLLSNGFKPRTSDSSINLNGGTYIYAAFAENPFKYSLAR